LGHRISYIDSPINNTKRTGAEQGRLDRVRAGAPRGTKGGVPRGTSLVRAPGDEADADGTAIPAAVRDILIIGRSGQSRRPGLAGRVPDCSWGVV